MTIAPNVSNTSLTRVDDERNNGAYIPEPYRSIHEASGDGFSPRQNVTLWAEPELSSRVTIQPPLTTFQSRTVLSLESETMSFPSGENAMLMTSLE
jgi:hypothetical protein